MTRRVEVRVSDSFFEELEAQLGVERGPAGEPSVTDFMVMDLPAIVERFASGFDTLPEAIGGVSSVRMFIGTATLVRAFVVHGVEVDGGIVELVGVELHVR